MRFLNSRGAPGAELDETLERFVVKHIETYEQLEILLLLRAHATRGWSAQSVAAELKIGHDLAARALGHLYEVGLLDRTRYLQTRYRYEPAFADTAAKVDELAGVCQGDRISVINIMTREAFDRIRTTLRTFSNRLDGMTKDD
jgi:hypothetical protein